MVNVESGCLIVGSSVGTVAIRCSEPITVEAIELPARTARRASSFVDATNCRRDDACELGNLEQQHPIVITDGVGRRARK